MLLNINKQHTLKSSIQLSGRGLQTNQDCTIRITSADVDAGITFIREDLPDKPSIPADCDYVNATVRCTKVATKDGTASISTIEHLMAALQGCSIDNAVIYVDGGEIPIMDGSSQIFVAAIQKAGIVEQAKDKEWYEITETIRVVDEESQAEMLLVPNQSYKISTVINFDRLGGIPLQTASLDNISHFAEEIASCRTFCFYSEIEGLLAEGLIKGGDIDNAIVVIDKNEKEIKHPSLQNLKFHNKAGVKTQTPLRYDNEFARHKLLDVVGDLALSGIAFTGHVVCTKPGHKINIALAKKIKQHINAKCKTINTNDFLTKKTLIDINQIKEYLPHRYPFLLVDKVVDIQEERIIAIKNVTTNEPFFVGHFPQEPLMPGVLVIEAMAQVGGVFILNKKTEKGEDIANVSTYFLKIDETRFRKKIIPGDVLVISMELLYQNLHRGLIEMFGKCFVDNTLCCEAKLVAQIVNHK